MGSIGRIALLHEGKEGEERIFQVGIEGRKGEEEEEEKSHLRFFLYLPFPISADSKSGEGGH